MSRRFGLQPRLRGAVFARDGHVGATSRASHAPVHQHPQEDAAPAAAVAAHGSPPALFVAKAPLPALLDPESTLQKLAYAAFPLHQKRRIVQCEPDGTQSAMRQAKTATQHL